MNDFDNIQCDEFISGEDFHAWVAWMEMQEENRDEEDRRWDDIRESIEELRYYRKHFLRLQ